MNRISVSIVEDERRTADVLVKALAKSDAMHCVSVHRNGQTAVAQIPHEKPDVALVDLHLPKLSGTECVRALRARLPDLKIIVFTKFDDSEHVFPALQAGANGYLLKKQPLRELISGILDAFRGGAPMSSDIAIRVVEYFHRKRVNSAEGDKLSPRERQILELLARGYLYKEISAELQISLHTVNSHIKKIYEKLHVHSRAEAVAKYVLR